MHLGKQSCIGLSSYIFWESWNLPLCGNPIASFQCYWSAIHIPKGLRITIGLYKYETLIYIFWTFWRIPIGDSLNRNIVDNQQTNFSEAQEWDWNGMDWRPWKRLWWTKKLVFRRILLILKMILAYILCGWKYFACKKVLSLEEWTLVLIWKRLIDKSECYYNAIPKLVRYNWSYFIKHFWCFWNVFLLLLRIHMFLFIKSLLTCLNLIIFLY